jgi:deoxyribodipyrimidine photolyase
VRDHLALSAAVATGNPVLPLYAFEPSLLRHPHTAPRHVQLIREGLIDPRESLSIIGARQGCCHMVQKSRYPHNRKRAWDLGAAFAQQVMSAAQQRTSQQ